MAMANVSHPLKHLVRKQAALSQENGRRKPQASLGDKTGKVQILRHDDTSFLASEPQQVLVTRSLPATIPGVYR